MPWWVILIIVFAVIFFGVSAFFQYQKEKESQQKLTDMTLNATTITAEEFLKNCDELIRRRNGSINQKDVSGVYVLYNETQNLYYIGQSKTAIKRVRDHLQGKGNGDVYADFKYGNTFTITIHNCPINELNLIEKTFIEKYNASGKDGYNKNKGNS